MDFRLVAAIIGVISGALGYWISTFWMQPILRYRTIRNRVHSNFIYYAQVISADGLNEDMQELHRERILANRKSSALLSAAFLELPKWYRFYLVKKKLAPLSAAKNLIGYSNTFDYEQSSKIQKEVREQLGLPPET